MKVVVILLHEMDSQSEIQVVYSINESFGQDTSKYLEYYRKYGTREDGTFYCAAYLTEIKNIEPTNL